MRDPCANVRERDGISRYSPSPSVRRFRRSGHRGRLRRRWTKRPGSAFQAGHAGSIPVARSIGLCSSGPLSEGVSSRRTYSIPTLPARQAGRRASTRRRLRRKGAQTASNAGLPVIAVDPAYTTRWGAQHRLAPLNSQLSTDVSGHHAAALTIGTRGLDQRARRRVRCDVIRLRTRQQAPSLQLQEPDRGST